MWLEAALSTILYLSLTFSAQFPHQINRRSTSFLIGWKKKKQDLRIHSDWLKNLDNLSSDRLNLPNLSSDWLKIFLTKLFSDWLKNLPNLSSDWLENLSFLTFPLIGLKSSFETVSELCKIKLKTNTKERNYLFPFRLPTFNKKF